MRACNAFRCITLSCLLLSSTSTTIVSGVGASKVTYTASPVRYSYIRNGYRCFASLLNSLRISPAVTFDGWPFFCIELSVYRI